jgi:hypothetical protein
MLELILLVSSSSYFICLSCSCNRVVRPESCVVYTWRCDQCVCKLMVWFRKKYVQTLAKRICSNVPAEN